MQEFEPAEKEVSGKEEAFGHRHALSPSLSLTHTHARTHTHTHTQTNTHTHAAARERYNLDDFRLEMAKSSSGLSYLTGVFVLFYSTPAQENLRVV